MLAGPEPEARVEPEARAFTTTAAYSGPTMQRPILQRLFGPGIMDSLGMRMDTVPAGMSQWPLISAGVAPGQVVEGTAAAAAVTAVFSTATLRPKRLTGRFEYTHEVAAQVLDLEQALRRDLADAVMSAMSAMSDAILNGAAVDPNDAATAANVTGFLTRIAAPTAPTAESAYADYAGSHATAVGGIHASMEREVSSVIGVASYTHSASVYQSGSGESGSEALTKRGGVLHGVKLRSGHRSEPKWSSRRSSTRWGPTAAGRCAGIPWRPCGRPWKWSGISTPKPRKG